MSAQIRVGIKDGSLEKRKFIFTIDTTKPGSASDTFTLPCGNIGVYNATIEWGDGTTSTITSYNDPDLTHVYSTPGIYTVKILGQLPYIRFNYGGDKLKIMSINQWGTTNQWRNMEVAFYGCTNLEIYATDVPDFSLVTSFFRAFTLCPIGTLTNANQWDMSSATTLRCMFQDTGITGHLDLSGWNLVSCIDIGTGGSFPFLTNAPLTSIDVSNWTFRNGGTSINTFIYNCDNLTTVTGINTWTNPEKVTSLTSFITSCDSVTTLDFSGMDLSGCGSFINFIYSNTSLTNVNVTGVTLKTTGTINLTSAFARNTNLTTINGIESFNSPVVSSLSATFQNSGLVGDLDLTSWDVSSVTTMNGCFMQLTGLNSLNISGWDLSSCSTWGTGQYSSCFYGCQIPTINVSNITLRPTGVNCAHTFTWMGSNSNVIGLDTWDVSRITSLSLFLRGAKITTTEYDKLLVAWDNLDPVDGLSVNFGTSKYTSGSAAETSRSNLISNDLWTITDGGGI